MTDPAAEAEKRYPAQYKKDGIAFVDHYWSIRRTAFIAGAEWVKEQLEKEIKELKKLAHEGLSDDCLQPGWSDVKFCSHRQGDGNKCKWCSNFI